jgi:hypothetical protein
MDIRSLVSIDEKLYISGGIGDTIARIDTILIRANGPTLIEACFDKSGNVQWAKSYGTNYSGGGYKLCNDTLGNLYTVGGHLNGAVFGSDTLYCNDINAIIVKTDTIGRLIWAKSLKTAQLSWTDFSSCWFLNTSPDGKSYIAGSFRGELSLGNYTASNPAMMDSSMFIARIDSDGTWKGLKTFPKGTGETVVTLSDGSPVVSGTFYTTLNIDGYSLPSYGDKDIFVGRLDVFTLAESPTRSSNRQLLIYSNPNNGTFRFEVPQELEHETELTLVITDLQGKEKDRFQVRMDALTEISLTNYASGTYLVRLSNGRKSYEGKMVVEE